MFISKYIIKNPLNRILFINHHYYYCTANSVSDSNLSSTLTTSTTTQHTLLSDLNKNINNIHDNNDRVIIKRKKKKQFKFNINNNLNLLREAEQLKLQNEKNDRITFDPIGYIESCFQNKNGSPRQGRLAPTSQGRIKILCRHADTMLKGLSDFSHVWIIFWFHNNYRRPEPEQLNNNKEKDDNNDDEEDNTTEDKEDSTESAISNILLNRSKYYDKSDYIYVKERRYPPPQVTVKPPMLNGTRIGVYGSRTPHRLVPIGLSMCKLERVEDDTIYISGIDMIDGTPIIDIKPYIPKFDSEPNATYPEWINSKSGIKEVVFTDEAIKGIIETLDKVGLRALELKFDIQQQQQQNNDDSNNSMEDKLIRVKKLITEILLNEPRSIYRKQAKSEESFGFYVDTLNVECKVDSNGVATVFDVVDSNEFELVKKKKKQQPTTSNLTTTN